MIDTVVGFGSRIKIGVTNASFEVMCPRGLSVMGNFDCMVVVYLKWRR